MAGTKVWTAGEVLGASDLNGNFAKLPYAYAAGTANSVTTALAAGATVGSITITYPVGRFTVAPILQAWTGGNRYIVNFTANAAGSATVAVRNVSDGAGGIETIYWTAVQMTSGTAAG
jgi:hypothetical protein